MQALLDFFRLDTSDAEVSRAQFKSFSTHMPLLYAILVCNALAITVSFFDPAL